MENKNEICSNCSYYEGVHGCKGHAPCNKLDIGGVMWDDNCPKYEEYKKEQK